jgi:integrase
VAGCAIARQRPGTAKGFVFLSLEDETGISNVIVNPDLYEKYRMVINREKFLRVEGVLQNQDHTISIKASRVLPISITGAETQSHDFHQLRHPLLLAGQLGATARLNIRIVRFTKLDGSVPFTICHAIVKLQQTPPFTPGEIASIFTEALKKIAAAVSYARHNALRTAVLVLFLRYSGLRISDAVGCRVEWVTPGKDGKDGYVDLWTRKNNVRVHVSLPQYVIDTLDRVPRMSEGRWFWTGNGKIETAVKDWQGRLAQLFKDAGIEGGHAHRFRDTFAVAMLEEGKTLQDVADRLGITLAVAQKHYNPWSKRRQEQANADVRVTWANDPFLKMLEAEARGTSEVREKGELLQ